MTTYQETASTLKDTAIVRGVEMNIEEVSYNEWVNANIHPTTLWSDGSEIFQVRDEDNLDRHSFRQCLE